MNAFGPLDGAAVEYWFWKFNVGRLAFLVDFIVRRSSGASEVRVCLWLDGVGRVLHEENSDPRLARGKVGIGRSDLAPNASSGESGDVSWDLRWTSGDTFMNPLGGLLGRFQPFDTAIVVWPHARFTGTVDVAGERFDLEDLAGTFYHYWGRSLSKRWIWLSATEFEDEPERRLEGLFGVSTRIYGRVPMVIPVGVLWTADGHRVHEIASGVNGLIRARADQAGIRISAIGRTGCRHRIAASWGPVLPNDLGEGIVTTLHGSATFDGHVAVPGTVGMEVRGHPHPAAG